MGALWKCFTPIYVRVVHYFLPFLHLAYYVHANAVRVCLGKDVYHHLHVSPSPSPAHHIIIMTHIISLQFLYPFYPLRLEPTTRTTMQFIPFSPLPPPLSTPTPNDDATIHAFVLAPSSDDSLLVFG